MALKRLPSHSYHLRLSSAGGVKSALLQEQAARFCLASEQQSGNLNSYDDVVNESFKKMKGE